MLKCKGMNNRLKVVLLLVVAIVALNSADCGLNSISCFALEQNEVCSSVEELSSDAEADEAVMPTRFMAIAEAPSRLAVGNPYNFQRYIVSCCWRPPKKDAN